LLRNKKAIMSKNSILVTDLVKKYKKSNFNAVDGINLEVEEGEIYGFLGPNGAGKTTAIKMFVTTLFPTGGQILVDGVDPSKDPTKVRQHIGVVYQQPSLDENLTAEENLRSHAILYNITPFSITYKGTNQKYKDGLKSVLELVGLYDKRFDIVKTYSGGMKRRLDIAKALFHRPKVLFLDEPTTGLDPQSRRAVWEYLETLQKEHKFTVFLTTQYLEEAEICDRISIIDHGKILVTDTPENLKKSIGEELLYLRPDKPSQLEEELKDKNMEYKKDEDGDYIIDIKNTSAQEVIKGIKTELSEINIKRPSLDDVFIMYTGRKI
jgi:ABC-2 type transport system ATP-binding protein